jgi:hypothetical protein
MRRAAWKSKATWFNPEKKAAFDAKAFFNAIVLWVSDQDALAMVRLGCRMGPV